MPVDMMFARVADLDAEILREFVRINRLKLRDLASILARIVVARGWLDWHTSDAFNILDDELKGYLKGEGHERYADMSFVEKFIGYGIRPVPVSRVREIQQDIMDKKLKEAGVIERE